MAGYEHLDIELPVSDAAFAKEYAAQRQMTLSELVDGLLQNLRRISSISISPKVQSWIGILPSDTDIDAVRMEYLTKTYLDDRHD